MAGKPIKNKKGRASRRQRRRRECLLYIGVFSLLFLCMGALGCMALVNGRAAEPAGGADEWYVQGGEMEILAQPVMNTLDKPAETAQSGLPFMQPTATPEPIVEPTPEPVRNTYAPLVQMEMEAPTPEPTVEVSSIPITITAVGDCTLGGDIPTGAYRTFESYVDAYGYDYFFSGVRDLFESDDLTIVNLEGPLTTSDDMRSGRNFNFRGEPEYVQILSGSSVEIANVANNHALDFGEEGFQETCDVLKEAGVGVSGFSRVYIADVKGVRVCSLGFTEWAYSQEQIEHVVGLARDNCDLLIVSMHWGREKTYDSTEEQRKLGRAIIDAGADVILGTHSHLIGGVEQYKGKYIIYSLGNFCFGGNRNPDDKDCMIFQQTFEILEDGTVTDGGISIIPARVSSTNDTNDFRPYVLEGTAGDKLLSKIANHSIIPSPETVLWRSAD